MFSRNRPMLIARCLAGALVLLAAVGSLARAQEAGGDKPKDAYDIVLCFDIEGSLRPAERKQLREQFERLVKQEDLTKSVEVVDYELPTYGPWPGPGTERDVICYTRIIAGGGARKFTMTMRFYYVRGKYNIILPDVTVADYGRPRLVNQFATLFRYNFPVEAQVLQKKGRSISLSRGSYATVRRGDWFVPVTSGDKWWDVFGQRAFQVGAVGDNSSVAGIPPDVTQDGAEAYLAALDRLATGQFVIRRNHHEGEYLKDTNSFRVIWEDDRSPVTGARLVYALGPEGDKGDWIEGPQLLDQSVALALPRGVPVTVKPILKRGQFPIDGQERFVERWTRLPVAETVLKMKPQFQDVTIGVIPDDVLPFVKVDGEGRRDMPLRLRWGTHRVEVVASAGEKWFPWRDTVSVPVPDGRFVVRLERDYKEDILDQLRNYYAAEEEAAFDPDRPAVTDRGVFLVEAVRMMEQCSTRHPQFLEVRYTVASVLAREGHVPEAIMTMTNYRTAAGLGREDVCIVERGSFSPENANLPRKWMWDWYVAHPGAAVDKVALADDLMLQVRALGGQLSAEDNVKINRYLLGLLFHDYAAGGEGRQYLSSDLDRALAYMLSYGYLNQGNWPTLGADRALNMSLTLFSSYHTFRALDGISAIVEKLKPAYEVKRREKQELQAQLNEGLGEREAQRLRRRIAGVDLHLDLVNKHMELNRARSRAAEDFMNYVRRLKRSEAFAGLDKAQQKQINALETEVANKITAVGGEIVKEAF